MYIQECVHTVWLQVQVEWPSMVNAKTTEWCVCVCVCVCVHLCVSYVCVGDALPLLQVPKTKDGYLYKKGG